MMDGDVPPWDHDEDGYNVILQELPKLEYIDRYYIVSEENMGDGFESSVEL